MGGTSEGRRERVTEQTGGQACGSKGLNGSNDGCAPDVEGDGPARRIGQRPGFVEEESCDQRQEQGKEQLEPERRTAPRQVEEGTVPGLSHVAEEVTAQERQGKQRGDSDLPAKVPAMRVLEPLDRRGLIYAARQGGQQSRLVQGPRTDHDQCQDGHGQAQDWHPPPDSEHQDQRKIPMRAPINRTAGGTHGCRQMRRSRSQSSSGGQSILAAAKLYHATRASTTTAQAKARVMATRS